MSDVPDTASQHDGPRVGDAATEVLGYLNFSGGKPDPGFQRSFNRLCEELGGRPDAEAVKDVLLRRLGELQGTTPAFSDTSQAEAVVSLVADDVLPAYERHHADLLAHLAPEEFRHPFLLARMFEATLAAGFPWDETERVTTAAVERLNDFLGYRPLAVLENGRRSQPYPHEQFRPVPIWIRDAGAAEGPYREIVERTIAMLRATPADELRHSYFDPDKLDELAVDVRAHDHAHPVNKRTNYMFGEWDPHVIDSSGDYRRFILRKVILDALVGYVRKDRPEPEEERLFDVAAVLCGTMLMASAISGSGPATHDSTVTLTTLLPGVARQRDAFYDRLLREADGERSERLARAAHETQQPFGHVRQELNMVLSRYGARQVQYRHLAWLYARLGFSEAAREQALRIPSASVRFETEIQWRLSSAGLELERGKTDTAVRLVRESRALLRRGIDCGAIVDPWNVLAFQGQFPLFAAREDAVPDQRIETLVDFVDQLFAQYGRTLAEAAAEGRDALVADLSAEFRELAEEWDGYATHVIEDLPKVRGVASHESAVLVADAVSAWRASGEASGDLSFWSRYVDRFPSSRAYALVVDALLRNGDDIASRALLVQWLGRADEVGLGTDADSLSERLLRWVDLATGGADGRGVDDPLPALQRFFDYLEANAGEFWSVPTPMNLADLPVENSSDSSTDEDWAEPPVEGAFDEEDELFGAAYDDVVYRDSTFDGIESDTLEEGGDSLPGTTEIERIGRLLETRLRFLQTLAGCWQRAAVALAPRASETEGERLDVVRGWWSRTRTLERDLQRLLRSVQAFEIPEPSGALDSNIEYDLQVQTKFYLMHAVVITHIAVDTAARSIAACLPVPPLEEDKESRDERRVVEIQRGVLLGDRPEIRRLLPRLVSAFVGKPLLYVPFDNGGEARSVLEVRGRQAVLRYLVLQLPRLGLLRETWHLLRTAYRMERSSRPEGVAVTEFDRLFRTAVRSSLEAVVEASKDWRGGRFDDAELVDVVGEVVDPFLELWRQHSRTMRLSSVESLLDEETWSRVRSFVKEYGDELFHARLLTLGNVRAILQHGVGAFLEHMEREDDPIKPSKLVEDLGSGRLDREVVVDDLELVYSSVVEKFDRFLEYNTTTTQSDYGRMFHCLLDFLRIEAEYEREAWSLLPVSLAHEVLCLHGRHEAALVWEKVYEERTREDARVYCERLDELERRYAMRLPSIRDRIHERFTRSLAVHRMLALVPRAAEEAREGVAEAESFTALRGEIERYLETTSGSGIDVPPWMRDLEKAVDEQETGTSDHESARESVPRIALQPIPLRELRRQLKQWTEPLVRRKRRS